MILNVRGIGTLLLRNKIRNLCLNNNISLLAILEPLVSPIKAYIEQVLAITLLTLALKSSFFGIIIFLWLSLRTHTSLSILNFIMGISLLVVSIIYVSCNTIDRRLLWGQLTSFGSLFAFICGRWF